MAVPPVTPEAGLAMSKSTPPQVSFATPPTMLKVTLVPGVTAMSPYAHPPPPPLFVVVPAAPAPKAYGRMTVTPAGTTKVPLAVCWLTYQLRGPTEPPEATSAQAASLRP